MKLDLQISKYIRGFKSNLIPKGKNEQTNNNKTVVECWGGSRAKVMFL